MGLPSGTHDRRLFRHYATLAADGSVAAIVEVADGEAPPLDGEQTVQVDVTDLYPYDFTDVKTTHRRGQPVDPDALRKELAALNRVPHGHR